MHGSLEPEDRVMDAPSVYEQVSSLAQKYGWEEGDNIVVEMAGTQVSGIDVGEVYNKSGSHLSALVNITKKHSLLSKIFHETHGLLLNLWIESTNLNIHMNQ